MNGTVPYVPHKIPSLFPSYCVIVPPRMGLGRASQKNKHGLPTLQCLQSGKGGSLQPEDLACGHLIKQGCIKGGQLWPGLTWKMWRQIELSTHSGT